MLLDEGGGLFAAHGGQGAGEHKGGPCQGGARLLPPDGRHVQPQLVQAADELLGGGPGEKLRRLPGHDAPEAGDGPDLLLCGSLEGLHGGKGLAEDLGRLGPDVGDAQGEYQPVQVVLLRFLHRGHQVFRAFFAETVQLCQLFRLQGVQVRRGADPPGLEQLLQDGGAQALDVHGVPGGEVDQVPQQLGGALGIQAPGGRLPFRPGDQLPAGGAALR